MAKSFRDRVKGMKKDLIKRVSEGAGDVENRERYGTVFNKSKFPTGVGIFKTAEGDNEIDVIQFIAGKNHPYTKEGELDYKIELFVHQNVGAGNKAFVCPNENFGKPCPICEYIGKSRLPKDEWQVINAKHRVFYLVWAHHGKEEVKGIQVADIAFHTMQKELKKIQNLPRGGGVIPWFDIEDGKTIMFNKEKKGDKKVEISGFHFIDRVGEIPDEIADASFPLDEVINMHPTYAEIKAAFEGGVMDEDDNKPSDKKMSKIQEEDVPDYCSECKNVIDECSCNTSETGDEPEVCDDCGELLDDCTCDPLDKMSLKELKQHVRKMEYEFKTAGLDEDEIREAIREAEAAKKKPAKKEEKTNKKSSKSKCPAGGTFGTDIDTMDDCGQCKLWDDCSDESDRLKK